MGSDSVMYNRYSYHMHEILKMLQANLFNHHKATVFCKIVFWLFLAGMVSSVDASPSSLPKIDVPELDPGNYHLWSLILISIFTIIGVMHTLI